MIKNYKLNKKSIITHPIIRVIFLLKKIIIGIISGFVSGLFGAGGGLIIVPSLMYILKIEPKKARGTAIFTVIPLVLVSSIFYIKNFDIDFMMVPQVMIGGVLGGYIRSKIIKEITRNVN